jgi:hypothetical protein
VLYFGSSLFKIGRLFLIAMMCVHFFACVFYRVKMESAASPDDVTAFYASKAVDPDVSAGDKPSHISFNQVSVALSYLLSRPCDCKNYCSCWYVWFLFLNALPM